MTTFSNKMRYCSEQRGPLPIIMLQDGVFRVYMICWIGEICRVRLNKADCKTPTLQIMIYRWCCDFASVRVDLLGSSQLICLTDRCAR